MIAKQNIPLYCMIVLGVVFTLLTPGVLAQELTTVPFEGEGLVVDCGFGPGETSCDVEHLFELADRILDVIIWLAVIGVAIVFIWHGFRLALNIFLPGGVEKEVEQAKKAMVWSLVGLIITLGSWLIVQLFFEIFGYRYDPFDYEAQVGSPETVEPEVT